MQIYFLLQAYLLTCLGGRHGYEAGWADLATRRHVLGHCESLEDHSAVAWPRVETFNVHGGHAGRYMIPIGGTRNSGINFLTWTQRFVNKVSKDRIVEGCDVLHSDGTRARTSDYCRNNSSKLEDIQATTNLIDPDCDIWE